MFKNRRLFKSFIYGLRHNEFSVDEARRMLKDLPAQVIRRIGKEIIFADYDGYNYIAKSSELCYFDSLDQYQKQFFIEQRLYKLYV